MLSRSLAHLLRSDAGPRSSTTRRQLAAATLAALVAVGGCQNAGSRDAQIRPDPNPAEVPTQAVASAGRTPEPIPEKAVAPLEESEERADLEVGGKRLTVTLADTETIKAALLGRLRQQTSFIEDRDYFIKAAEHGSAFISEGSVNIAGWNLQVRDDQLQLYYRMPARPMGMAFYTADLKKSGREWTVGDIVQGHIHARR